MHRHVQYTQNMFFPSGHETRLDTEFDRSKSCFIISFAWWTKLVNRNMILHNVSHKRSLSQSMSAASCIPSIFMTIDKSSKSRIKKLPSSYSSELAEGKVFPEKNKKDWETFIFFMWSILQNSVHSTWLLFCFKWGNLSKSYWGCWSYLPLAMAPLFVLALSRLFISSECFMIRN